MRRRAMTLIEMVVCLAIIALCLVALVRGVGGLGLLSARDAALVPQVEALLAELEAAPPEERSGYLEGGWRYETVLQNDVYVLRVTHERWHETHVFLVREGPS